MMISKRIRSWMRDTFSFPRAGSSVLYVQIDGLRGCYLPIGLLECTVHITLRRNSSEVPSQRLKCVWRVPLVLPIGSRRGQELGVEGGCYYSQKRPYLMMMVLLLGVRNRMWCSVLRWIFQRRAFCYGMFQCSKQAAN